MLNQLAFHLLTILLTFHEFLIFKLNKHCKLFKWNLFKQAETSCGSVGFYTVKAAIFALHVSSCLWQRPDKGQSKGETAVQVHLLLWESIKKNLVMMLHFPAPLPISSSSSSLSSSICKIHLWHTFSLQRRARIDREHYGSTNAHFRMSDVGRCRLKLWGARRAAAQTPAVNTKTPPE